MLSSFLTSQFCHLQVQPKWSKAFSLSIFGINPDEDCGGKSLIRIQGVLRPRLAPWWKLSEWEWGVTELRNQNTNFRPFCQTKTSVCQNDRPFWLNLVWENRSEGVLLVQCGWMAFMESFMYSGRMSGEDKTEWYFIFGRALNTLNAGYNFC